MQVRYTARYFKNMKKKTGSLYPESKTQMAFFPEIDIYRQINAYLTYPGCRTLLTPL